jgi:hypothetical protein
MYLNGMPENMCSKTSCPEERHSCIHSSDVPPHSLLACLPACLQVVISFVRRTLDDAAHPHHAQYMGWGGDMARLAEVPWRRSAIQFVLDMQLHHEHPMCLSLHERLKSEAERIDTAISRSVMEQVHPPAGVPSSHWWFFMSAAAAHQ